MLHVIKPSSEAELRAVLAFQRKVLAFGCDPTLRVPLEPDRMNAFFGEQADWFRRHSSLHKPVEELNTVLKAMPELSSAIMKAFDNDVVFDMHVNDPGFTFACCRLDAQVQKSVNDLLVVFYDLLGRDGGFSAEITGSNRLTRDAVVQGFWSLNSPFRVCPACDGPRPDKANGKVHSQCDHHFPKSKHAALSIHPLNLVPTCTDCNVTFKRENDANDRAHLSEMFLPYKREAFGPLAVEVFRDGQGKLSVRLRDGDHENTPRIQSLNHVLQLEDRWTDRLRTRVSAVIVNSLRHQISSAVRRGNPIDDFKADLAAQRQGAGKSRGMQPDSILAEAYFSFVEADDSERDSLLKVK